MTEVKQPFSARQAAYPDIPGTSLNPAHQRLIQWFDTVRFRRTVLGGVDEVQLWKKLEELYVLYEEALTAERARYDALLQTEEGRHAD